MVRFNSLAEYFVELQARKPDSNICRATLEHRPYMSGLIIAVSVVVGHIGPEGMLVECSEFVGERTSHVDTLSQEIISRAQRRLADIEQRIRAIGIVVAMGRYDVQQAKGGGS